MYNNQQLNIVRESPENIIANLSKTSRVKVCIVTKNQNGEYLLLKRKPDDSYPNIWECPGGKYEFPESCTDCVLRELREETGITKIKSLEHLFSSIFYEDSTDKTVYVFYYCIETDERMISHPEHSASAWLQQQDAANVVPFEGPKKAILSS